MRRVSRWITGMPRLGTLAGALVLITGLAGCGDDVAREQEASGLSTQFSLTPADGGQEAAGHGISLVVPDDWMPSGEEQLDPQGRTYEWAVEAPDGTSAFPPFVSMSMGVPGETNTGYEAAPEALKTLEGVSPDFEVIEEGELDVEGVENAYQIRYERSASFQGEPVQVELVQVFLDMPDDVLSTVRFQAPAGEFDESGMAEVLDSLAVDVEA